MIDTSTLTDADNGRVVIYPLKKGHGRGKLIGKTAGVLFLEVVKSPYGQQPKTQKISVEAKDANFES